MADTHANGSAQAQGANSEYHNQLTVPVSPNVPEQIPELLEKVHTLGKTVDVNNTKERIALLDNVRALMFALETPREAMIRHCWSWTTLLASVEVAVDLGLWHLLAKDDKPKTVDELAQATGAEPLLLSRILKHLCAMGTIIETGPNEYRRTGFAITMTMKRFADSYPCMTNCVSHAALALPAFLKKNGYRIPTNGKDCPFQAGYRTDLHFFEFFQKYPEVARQFNNHMSAYHQGRPSWMDFYDVRGLINGVNLDDVLLVDVGGNVGHDLTEFKRKWPDAPGRLILQDLPEVIGHAKDTGLPSAIEPMPHDFFTEQPVKGARAYFMHSILHDWSDEKGREILTQLAKAMKPGFSKLLINENVIPATEASWESTSIDVLMMTLLASQERTAAQWQQLVESAGLKVVKIWTDLKGAESLIECELA